MHMQPAAHTVPPYGHTFCCPNPYGQPALVPLSGMPYAAPLQPSGVLPPAVSCTPYGVPSPAVVPPSVPQMPLGAPPPQPPAQPGWQHMIQHTLYPPAPGLAEQQGVVNQPPIPWPQTPPLVPSPPPPDPSSGLGLPGAYEAENEPSGSPSKLPRNS